MAIQKYLRSAEFTYSLQSPVQGGYDGNGLSVLADFLTQKSGYCIHFASAMAVMARLEGIPSRIAVGYAPGRSTGATVSVAGQGAAAGVRGRLPGTPTRGRSSTSRAWAGSPFEPTPSRGVVPAYATEAAAPSGASTNEHNDALTPGDGSTPGAGPHLRARSRFPERGQPTAADPRPAQAALRRRRGAAAGAARGVPAAGPRTGAAPPAEYGGPRQWRRGPAAPAWAELRDLATDYGVAPGASETPRHFSGGCAFAGAGRAGVSRNPPARTVPASGPRRP